MFTDPSRITTYQAQARLRLDPSRIIKTRQPLPDLIKYYLVSCRVEGKSPKTIEKYAQCLGVFERFMTAGGYELISHHYRLFLLHLQDRKLKPVSIYKYFEVLRTFTYWLIREGLLDENPLATIKAPRVPVQVVKPLTIEQIHHLLLVAGQGIPSGNVRRSDFLPLRNTAIVLLFLDTGLRLSELAGIQLTDIDAAHDCILVMGKGSKERRVRMGATTHKAVLRYVLARNDTHPCLWVTEERRPMKRDGIQSAVERMFKLAEITGVKPGPHTLRHTAAISYLRNGGDWFTLQVMLGHASPVMTRRYLSSLGSDDMMRVHEKASPVDNLRLR